MRVNPSISPARSSPSTLTMRSYMPICLLGGFASLACVLARFNPMQSMTMKQFFQVLPRDIPICDHLCLGVSYLGWHVLVRAKENSTSSPTLPQQPRWHNTRVHTSAPIILHNTHNARKLCSDKKDTTMSLDCKCGLANSYSAPPEFCSKLRQIHTKCQCGECNVTIIISFLQQEFLKSKKNLITND